MYTYIQILALTLLLIHTVPGGSLQLLRSLSLGERGPTPLALRATLYIHSPLRDCDGLLLSLPLRSLSLGW